MPRKRSPGEGSVYERKDGRWVAQVPLPNGKRKYRYGNTKAEAEARLSQLLVDLGMGLDLSPSTVTVHEHMRYYLDSVRKVTVRPTTWKREDTVYRTHVEEHLGPVQLSRLTPRMLQEIVTRMVRDGYAPRTVHYPIEVMKRGLDHAVMSGLVPSNPALAVALPPVTHREIHPLDIDELERFWDVVTDGHPLLFAAYILAPQTALRWGELFGLSWDNVFSHSKELLVDQQLSPQGITRNLKTKNSRRRVPIPALALETILEHRELYGEGPDRLVFFTHNRTPFGYHNVRRNFTASIKKAGLEYRTFHDLRHTAATNMIKQGIDLRTVMEVMGHGDISTTLNTYVHVLDSMRDEARARLDALYTWTR